jgi:phosphatidate cytidylyltransferase
MSNLTRRVLFAVIAAPLAIVAIYVGDAVLVTVLSTIAALGAWEYCRIARAAGADPLDGVAIVAAALVPLVVHAQRHGWLHWHVNGVAVAALAVLGLTIFVRGPGRRPLLSAATTVFGVAYVAMIAYVYTIRYHDYVVDAAGGTALVMLPILLTWATDIGAYAFGRMFGEKKLIPHVSPGKTVAGAVGGVVATVVLCWAYSRYVMLPLAHLGFTTGGVLIFGIVISVVAQIGDLAESLIKREAGIKDSSNIIPGHGGVLDRFDSMLFVLPVAAMLLRPLLSAARF